MREEPSAYRSVRSLVRFVLRRWFRRVEVVGEERLPREGGGILVSWHPNGLLDPALIVAEVPRPVIFGARHGLFRWPLLGTLMKAAGAVPIYRATDVSHLSAEERRAQNQQSLDALALAVAEGGLSCLFPEGDSHDEPHLLELKTGVARFYERACALTPEGAPRPVILPVGLHYADKDSFRSHALVSFHPPLEVAEMDPDASDRYEVLTDRIEEELREVVHATESWEAHYLMHRARKIVLTERAKRAGALSAPPTMSERVLGLAEIWRAYYAGLDAHPEETQLLEAKVRLYDRDLRSLGLDDHELDRSPDRARPLQILGLALQILAVFVLLPPLLVFGVVVNLPAAILLWLSSKVFAKRRKDEATIKVLLGVVLLPVSWGLVGWLAFRGSELLYRLDPALPDARWSAAIVVVSLGMVGGMVALRYLRLLGETLRAMRVRLTRGRRRHALIRLLTERAEIYEGFVDLAAALEPASEGDPAPSGGG
ncbi:MAG: 1-acyl-sn-glycerol-3-phosphate acyltransferase [Polyangiaceae bacterium]